jgi:flagellar basal body-associated protein FliL
MTKKDWVSNFKTIMASHRQMEFNRGRVRFPEVTINDIGEGRRTGLMRVSIVLEVKLKHKQEIANAVERFYPQLMRCEMPILSNYDDELWKGKRDGVKLRNEIGEEFNRNFRAAGQPTIEGVLFDTFNIQ